MKRLGIDIDGTVTCPSSLIPYINKHFSLNLTLNDITRYELTEVLNISSEEFGKWFGAVEADIYKNSPLAEGAKSVLDQWKEEYELYFISARPSKLTELTKIWFSQQDVTYHHIELIGSHNKISTAKKYNVDIFFEDKHDNAVDIHNELQIPVILFNTPYNQDPIPEGVIRVNNWSEAKETVEKLLGSSR